MRKTIIPEQTIIEYTLDVQVPDQALRVEVLDSKFKCMHSGRGDFNGYLQQGLYKVRVGTQSCLIDLVHNDAFVTIDDEGFVIRDGLKLSGELQERRESFPKLLPFTAEGEVVTEPDGIYDAIWSGWFIKLIFQDGGFSKEYNASSGVRGTLVERVEVRETKIFPYSTKKRYE